jgi:hypothetical protein
VMKFCVVRNFCVQICCVEKLLLVREHFSIKTCPYPVLNANHQYLLNLVSVSMCL